MSTGDSCSSSDEEWEDVERLPTEGSPPLQAQEKNSAGLEIVLSTDGSTQRKRKQNVLERALAAFHREVRYNLHKASLLCLLVHGMRLSHRCNNTLLHALLLSLLPRQLHTVAGGIGSTAHVDVLTKLLKWFVARKDHILTAVRDCEATDSEPALPEKSQSEAAERNGLSVVQVLVTLLRAIGLRARLVLVLNPLSFKLSPQKKDTFPMNTAVRTPPSKAETPTHTQSPNESALELSLSGPSVPPSGSMFYELLEQCGQADASGVAVDCGSMDVREEGGEEEGEFDASSRESVRGGSKRIKSSDVKGGTAPKKRRVSKTSPGQTSTPQEGSASMSGKRRSARCGGGRGNGKSGKGVSRAKQKSTTTSCVTSPYFGQDRDGDNDDDVCVGGEESKSECSVSDDSDFVPVKRTPTQRVQFTCGRSESEGEDSDIGGSGRKKRSRTEGSKNLGGKRNKGKGVKGKPESRKKGVRLEAAPCASSESGEHGGNGKRDSKSEIYDETTSWVEVFLEGKKRFVCLHLPSCSVDQPRMCEKRCPHKMSYIIAIESGDYGARVSDVTARYASDWCTTTRKLRLSESWWREALAPYAVSREEREMEEDDIMSILHSRPLPTSINDYKSHPLYALRSHLLKFEVIYPVDSQILGYCKSEAVYSRDCVATLHTRETWLKEGRVVKKGEEPFKVVKARGKKGQSVLERQSKTVEVFGRWQTEVYVPPPVVDGVVPRNEYGNVELFQPSMLPAGACHIRIAGINKVARKLEVDYAPAMMGWDFHSGYCHPIIEGIVVAQESEAMLLEAWMQEEQLIIEKEMKKRESRVLERWKKLIRGVLIRERVKRTYSRT